MSQRQREVRLDFFRGLAMFIIFIAHTPGNWWAGYIPARFGTSDATEMFVFCSGYASAIAFGSVFAHQGFWLGASRIVYRCWQIYWVHLCMFLAILTVVLVANEATGVKDYVGELNLWPFMDETGTAVPRLLTFTYVPNYFDILPMYFGVLLMVPIVMLLARVHIGAVVAFCVGVWLYNFVFDIQLPAEWWSDREWFFDPFGWQLIFFFGFAFGAKWFRAPPLNAWLVALSVAFVVAMLFVSYYPLWQRLPEFAGREAIVEFWAWGKQKTDFGPLRWLHFAALAYLVTCIFRDGRENVLRGRWARPIIMVGQQALATFATSMLIARVVSIGLDAVGRTPLTMTIANLWGFAVLIVVARCTQYFKSTPWARKPAPKAGVSASTAQPRPS